MMWTKYPPAPYPTGVRLDWANFDPHDRAQPAPSPRIHPHLARARRVTPRDAQAQNVGGTFNLQLFRPAVDSKGYITVNASQILGHLDFSIGLVGT